MYNNPWNYNGANFTSDMIDNFTGFVYLIINNKTGKKYIGKKLFFRSGYRQVNKKRKKVRIESDWKKYYGSNPILKEEAKAAKEDFNRIILRLCRNKTEMSYYELEHQILHNALLSDEFYNEYIHVRVNVKHLIGD